MMSIDGHIDAWFQPVAEAVAALVFFAIPLGGGLEIKFILLLLLSSAVFFTVYLGFINFRYFKHGIDVVTGKYGKHNVGDGELSTFQALATSLSGTVGLGNIAGVAVAVSVGGPGAVFWMVVMGLLSMSTKFAEVTLGVKYRHHPDPEHRLKIAGGPMYYLRDALANRNIPYLGPVAAGLFAFACICGAIGGGNMFQANQAFQQVVNVTGGADGFMADKGWLFGLGLAFLVGLVIIGGLKSIAAVSARIVPFMGVLYLSACLIVILLHIGQLPHALAVIVTEAFVPQAGVGGLMGALLVGVQRAAFSNESGLGSAAIVYCTTRTNSPVSQGMASMVGPFIDTVVVCSATALMIVITGVYQGGTGVEGVELTSRAMSQGIPFGPEILAMAVFLFAYSTLITWAYYGEIATAFLFGQGRTVEMVYKFLFCGCVVVGASVQLSNLINFSDAMILAMGIPNIIGLFFLAPEIRRDVKRYIAELKAEEGPPTGKRAAAVEV